MSLIIDVSSLRLIDVIHTPPYNSTARWHQQSAPGGVCCAAMLSGSAGKKPVGNAGKFSVRREAVLDVLRCKIYDEMN